MEGNKMNEINGRITMISKDFPLIVSDTSQPMEYDTIYFEKGGYIEIRCGSKFSINKLVKYDESMNIEKPSLDRMTKNQISWDYDIIVVGRDGEDGDEGGNGGIGGTGANGGNGGDGTPGRNGYSRSDMTLIIKDSNIDISVLNTGSCGGEGGKGGKGGDGGDGIESTVQGGKGGDGGNGGNGGNGGDSCNLTIKWGTKTGNELTTNNQSGKPGEGGSGGIAGKNGKYSANIENGKDGNRGNRGLEGRLGKITVIDLEEEK